MTATNQQLEALTALTKETGMNPSHFTIQHGHSRSEPGRKPTRTYQSWSTMKSRCLRSTDPGYHYYGRRGIKIAPEWMEFANFLKDMGKRPEGRTLDRINNDGDYEPRNCRWATPVEQAATQRNSKREQTHCKRGHEFTRENTHITKGRYRTCKECVRISHRAHSKEHDARRAERRRLSRQIS